MLQHHIFESGLTSQDGRNLTFAANQHLFLWPGALVFGEARPEASDRPDVLKEKGVEDWARGRWTQNLSVEYPDRSKDVDALPPPAPNETIRDLREQLLRELPSQRKGLQPLGFARPNQAAAFDARRARHEFLSLGEERANPVLEALQVQTLNADLRYADTDPKPTFLEGAKWVLDSVATDFLAVRSLIPPNMLEGLGPQACGRVLAQYLATDASKPAAQRQMSRFEGQVLKRAEDMIEVKLGRIESEIYQWADAGRLPVLSPDGSTDAVLTCANAATAISGIYHLCSLAIALQDFRSSARLAFGGILAELA